MKLTLELRIRRQAEASGTDAETLVSNYLEARYGGPPSSIDPRSVEERLAAFDA